MLHEALRVAALGFEPDAGAGDAAGAVSVLVTPWVMNLVGCRCANLRSRWPCAQPQIRAVGNERFEFRRARGLRPL